MRKILIKVWQKEFTPKQALRELIRAGPKLNFNKGKKKKILEILSALRGREIITVNKAEQELKEEGLYEYNGTKGRVDENLCQI